MEKTISRNYNKFDDGLTKAVRSVQSTSVNVPNTFGWDTVFGITYAQVNTAIVNAGVTPPDFSIGSGPAATSANFNSWALETGGGGKNIRMNIPMTDLTLNGTNYGLAQAHINVVLTFQPMVPDRLSEGQAAGKSAESEPDRLQLKFKPPQLLGAGETQDPAVEVVSIDYNGTVPSMTDASVIRGQLQSWFNALDDFDFVFATVNVNEKAATGDFDWMKPLEWSYAVSDRTDENDSVFGVMAILDGTTDGLAHQVSEYVIPTGESAAFLISKEAYLKNMLMDGLAVMFSDPGLPDKQWPQDYFELSENGTAIRNSEELVIDELEVKASSKGKGKCEKVTLPQHNFTVRFQDTCLELSMLDFNHKMRGWFEMGIFDVHHSIRMELNPRLDNDLFCLTTGEGSDHVVLTKDPVAEWVELGVLVAVLALNVWGVTNAVRSVKAAKPAVQSGGATGSTSAAPLPNPPTVGLNEARAAGATTASETIGTGVVKAEGFMEGFTQALGASNVMKVAGVLDVGLTIYGVLETIATLNPNQHEIKDLPSFKEFATKVMAQVTWPSGEAEFTPTQVAFNGGFQVTGTPDFS